MNREELGQSWKQTKSLLDAAVKLLSPSIAQTDEGLIRYQEWIEHNELELALGELESIGAAVSAPKRFWEELEKAKINMGLTDRFGIICATCGKFLATYNTQADNHRPSPEELFASGCVPVPNFGWFCTQACGDEYEKKVGRKLFQRDSEGHIRYYP